MKYAYDIAPQIEAGSRLYKFDTVTTDAGELVYQVRLQALRFGKPYGPIGNHVKVGKPITIREDSGEQVYKSPLEHGADGKLIKVPFIREASGYPTLEAAIAAVHKHAEKPYVPKGRHADKLRAAGKLPAAPADKPISFGAGRTATALSNEVAQERRRSQPGDDE